MEFDRHPLEHLGLDTIEYFDARLNGDLTMFNDRKSSQFIRLLARHGESRLRELVGEVLA